jgi:DNA repair protein RecN (Recombination protein N)
MGWRIRTLFRFTRPWNDLHGAMQPYIITDMLESLQLNNIILVTSLAVDFRSGFNVITGETGAGKSLIIKSLGLLAGQQALASMILPGQDMAFIEATFVIPDTVDIPKEYLDNGRLTVSRRLYRSRPTVNKLNYESVSLKILKNVMSKVIFLTAQHQVIELLDSANHMPLFDAGLSATAKSLQSDYLQAFDTYTQWVLNQTALTQDQAKLDAELVDLTALIQDIESAAVTRGEDTRLQEQQATCDALHDRKKMVETTQRLANTAVDTLQELDATVVKLTHSRPGESLLDAGPMIEDLTRLSQAMTTEMLDIDYLETLDVDTIQARLNQLFKLKVKYQVTTLDDLLDAYEAAKKRRDELVTLLENAATISVDVDAAKQRAMDLADQLYQQRMAIKAPFETALHAQLAQLGMADARLDVQITRTPQLNRCGQDTIEFMFSANPNMPLCSLKKVASGGELSRVMLALIVGQSSVLNQPLLIFDEVDAGVGGLIANYMGDVLAKLAKNHQLLVVTHLPQIARCADAHFTITKKTTGVETCVNIEEIRKEDVPTELQRMVGGDVVASMIK